MDVFVIPEFRGRGISKTLMRAVIDHPELQGLRVFLLGTRDAHGLYAQFGFRPLEEPEPLDGDIRPEQRPCRGSRLGRHKKDPCRVSTPRAPASFKVRRIVPLGATSAHRRSGCGSSLGCASFSPCSSGPPSLSEAIEARRGWLSVLSSSPRRSWWSAYSSSSDFFPRSPRLGSVDRGRPGWRSRAESACFFVIGVLVFLRVNGNIRGGSV